MLFERRELPARRLFWRFNNDPTGSYAVRDGDYKLVAIDGQLRLFDLANDPGERRDLAGDQPDRLKLLNDAYRRWLTEVVPPPKVAPR